VATGFSLRLNGVIEHLESLFYQKKQLSANCIAHVYMLKSSNFPLLIGLEEELFGTEIGFLSSQCIVRSVAETSTLIETQLYKYFFQLMSFKAIQNG